MKIIELKEGEAATKPNDILKLNSTHIRTHVRIGKKEIDMFGSFIKDDNVTRGQFINFMRRQIKKIESAGWKMIGKIQIIKKTKNQNKPFYNAATIGWKCWFEK